MQEHQEEFGEAFRRAEDLAERLQIAWGDLSEIGLAVVLAMFELKQRAPRQYAVFVMRNIHGLVPQQIATVLQISRTAVDQHHGRAKRALARRLAGYEEVQSWLRATGRRDDLQETSDGPAGQENEEGG